VVGVKGAFQAGVLKFLLGVKEERYDIITGVSVGALNGAFVSQFHKNDAYIAAKELENFWLSINNDSIYENWCIPYVSAIWKSSIYNSAPLQKLIRKNIHLTLINNCNREVIVGAVNLTNGNYRTFSNYRDPVNFINGVIASSAFPGFFCPIEIGGDLYSDGGIKEITPLKAAIEAGATDIDIIICSPEYTTSKISKNPNTLDLLMHTIDLMSDEIMSGDLVIAQNYNKLSLVGASSKKNIPINIYRPKANLVDNSLDFSHEAIVSMIETGYNLAFSKG